VQGLVAGASNIVTVGVIGTLLIFAYAKTRGKSGSLDKEESV
jgi:energy-coupling factor transport system substrate-specific component